jgi:cytochrome c oxidase subunit IV
MAEAHQTTGVHVVPLKVLVAVWAGLVFLTWLTFAASRINLGSLNLWVAMGIATAKGSLVLLYFMHLRWDKRFYALVFVGTLLFVMLFVGGVLIDTTHYQSQMIPGYAPGMHGQ